MFFQRQKFSFTLNFSCRSAASLAYGSHTHQLVTYTQAGVDTPAGHIHTSWSRHTSWSHGLYIPETYIIYRWDKQYSLRHKSKRGRYLRVQYKLINVQSGENAGFSCYINIGDLYKTCNLAVLLQVAGIFSFPHSAFIMEYHVHTIG